MGNSSSKRPICISDYYQGLYLEITSPQYSQEFQYALNLFMEKSFTIKLKAHFLYSVCAKLLLGILYMNKEYYSLKYDKVHTKTIQNTSSYF